MPSFGRRSLDRLETCSPAIQSVCHEVIKHYDFTVIVGLRGKAAQEEAFRTGHSNARWPYSRHNAEDPKKNGEEDPNGVSRGIDIAPWFRYKPKIRWDQEREFIQLSGYMLMAAAAFSIEMRWGGDWDKDHDLYDRNRPFDLGHYEVKE